MGLPFLVTLPRFTFFRRCFSGLFYFFLVECPKSAMFPWRSQCLRFGFFLKIVFFQLSPRSCSYGIENIAVIVPKGPKPALPGEVHGCPRSALSNSSSSRFCLLLQSDSGNCSIISATARVVSSSKLSPPAVRTARFWRASRTPFSVVT